jgi:hypothetical protein
MSMDVIRLFTFELVLFSCAQEPKRNRRKRKYILDDVGNTLPGRQVLVGPSMPPPLHQLIFILTREEFIFSGP